jgi:hypothetical protein
MISNRRFISISIGLIVGLIFASASWAGTISMNSSFASKEVDGKQGLEVSVQNDGDEAARAVQIHVELAGEEQTGPKWENMAPKEKKSQLFFFEKIPPKPGTYPALVTIDFADLNMYPFTALNVAAMQVGSSSSKAQIFAKADSLTISKSGTLSMSVKNLDAKPKSLKARVLAPRELDVKPILFEMELAANSTVDRSIEVANFSALPGAGYPIFIIFEYDQGDVHYSHPLVSPIKIAQGGLSNTNLTVIITLGAVIFLAAIVFEIVRRTRKA